MSHFEVSSQPSALHLTTNLTTTKEDIKKTNLHTCKLAL